MDITFCLQLYLAKACRWLWTLSQWLGLDGSLLARSPALQPSNLSAQRKLWCPFGPLVRHHSFVCWVLSFWWGYLKVSQMAVSDSLAAKRQVLEGHRDVKRGSICSRRSAGIAFSVEERHTILENKLSGIQYFLQFSAAKKCCTGISATRYPKAKVRFVITCVARRTSWWWRRRPQLWLSI